MAISAPHTVETFTSGNRAINSGATGNFASVTGSGIVRPLGPTASGQTGIGHSILWNSDNNDTVVDALMEIDAAAGGSGWFAFWFYPREYDVDGLYHRLAAGVDSGGTVGFSINYNQNAAAGTGNLYLAAGGGATSESASPLTVNIDTPIFVVVSYRRAGGGRIDMAKLYAGTDPESLSLVESDVYDGTSSKQVVDVAFDTLHSTARPIGCMGGFAAGLMDDAATDAPTSWTTTTGLTAPTIEAQSWYVDVENGDNANDGTASDRAWADLSIWEDIQGIVPVDVQSMGGGDTMYIDAPDDNRLRLAADTTMRGVGLHLRPASGESTIHMATRALLANASAVQESGAVYKWTSVSEAADYGDLWEDDLPLQQLELDDYANEAALLADMANTPATYWVNAAGDTVYVHPRNSTVPTSDGKVYELSQDVQFGISGGYWLIDNGGVTVHGSVRRAHDDGGDFSAVSYSFHIGGLTGTSDLELYATGGMNHTIGAVGGIGGQVITMRGSIKWVQDNAGPGGATTTVSFHNKSSYADGVRATWAANVVTVTNYTHRLTVGEKVLLQNCTPSGYDGIYVVASTPSDTSLTFALTGDPGGAASAIDISSEFTHNYRIAVPASTVKPNDAAGAQTYDAVFCHNSPVILDITGDVSGGGMSIDSYASDTHIHDATIRNAELRGSIGPATVQRLVENTVIYDAPMGAFNPTSASLVTLQKNLIQEIDTAQAAIKGSYLIQCSVIDARDLSGSIWQRTGALTLTLSKCLILLPAGSTVLEDAVSTDTLSLENCAIATPTGDAHVIFDSYDDGGASDRTLAQLTTLGVASNCHIVEVSALTAPTNWKSATSYLCNVSAMTPGQAQEAYDIAIGNVGGLRSRNLRSRIYR
jgi:hypothetical protein